jgi:hypothetical protein
VGELKRELKWPYRGAADTCGIREVGEVGAVIDVRAERDEVYHIAFVAFTEQADEGEPQRGIVVAHGAAVVQDENEVNL